MISKELETVVKEIFEQYGETITNAVKETLAKSNLNATGALSNSVSFKVGSDENSITLEIWAEQYLKFIEEGRASGKMPPVQSIVKWIEAKNIDVPSRKPGIRFGGIESRGVTSYPGTRRGKAAIIRRNVKMSNLQFGFAIAKNIMRKGQIGKGIIKPIMLTVSEELTKKITEAVKTSIENDIHYAWKEGATIDNIITYQINF